MTRLSIRLLCIVWIVVGTLGSVVTPRAMHAAALAQTTTGTPTLVTLTNGLHIRIASVTYALDGSSTWIYSAEWGRDPVLRARAL